MILAFQNNIEIIHYQIGALGKNWESVEIKKVAKFHAVSSVSF